MTAGECPAQPVLVERSGERHALSVRAAHRAQGDDLLGQVHPLGHGLQPEIGGDAQQPAGDLVQPGGLDDALDQTAVELQDVDGESPEGRDRRAVAAEPVERDPDADPPQGAETPLQLVRRDLRVGVGQLDDQRPGRQPVPREQRLDRAERHRPVQQPAGAHPDDDRHGQPGRLPLGGLLDGLLDHPPAQLGGLVAVLGHAQELRRGEEHPLRGAPARLRGHRRDPAVLQADHRLVQQGELAVVQRGPQARGQLRLAYDVLLHLRLVQLDPALAAGLGAVHGQVGVAQQLARAEARFREGHTDGGVDTDIAAVDEVRLGQRRPEAVGEFHYVPFPGGPVAGVVPDDQGRELVAAQPGGGVALPDRVLESAGGLDQQLVPRLVPDRVVDGLEAVEIDEQHGRVPQGHAPVGGPAAGERVLDALGEQGAVGQVRERVVLGVVLQLGLEPDPFGHVPAVEDEAAVMAVDGRLDVQPASVTRPETALDARSGLLTRVGGEESPRLVHDAAQVLRMDETGQFRAHQILRRAAVHTGGGRGDVPEDTAGRGDHDHVAGALHQGAEVVLLLRQFLGEGDVVEQHDALAHDEREHDRATGQQDHAVDAAAVEDVVEDPQGAHGGREIGREGGEGAGDGPGGRVPAELASGRGWMVVRAAALPGHVLVHHARVPHRALPALAVPLGVRRAGPGPRGVRQEQRAREPARVEQLT